MKTCPITKKSPQKGGKYANRTRATVFTPTGKHWKLPNLQKKTIYVPELKKSFSLRISTDAIKLINKRGAYVTLKKAGIIK